MLRTFLFLIFTLATTLPAFAQMTQLATNNELERVVDPRKKNVVLLEAGSKKLWVSDATTNGDNEFWQDLYRFDGNLVPLPVNLVNFSVPLAGTDARLTWKTASEENTREFMVKRSNDGRQFTSIGVVPAAGTSGVKSMYGFNDIAIAESAKAMVYNRLTAKDMDGKNSVIGFIKQ